MLTKLAPRPLFVEGAITTGKLFLKCDFTAIKAGVSIISQASLDIVFPLAGATIIISVKCLGPMGSASWMVWIMSFSEIFFISSINPFALPNLVSSS